MKCVPSSFVSSSRPDPGPGGWMAATVTDAALALAARVGDRPGREAFVEIVRRHQTAVCAVAWSVTGRVALTDDIAQETFFKAWRQIGTLRDPARLKAWLTKIAHDCAVDALRREQRQSPPQGGCGPDSAFAFRAGTGMEPGITMGGAGASWASAAPSPDASPDKAAADAEEEALVWSALAALPETWRTPLVLFYQEGKSVAAVASTLALSEDAVRQRLSRGRQVLRTAVESRIEMVLGRVRPSPLLVVTIAAGLGLFSKSAALAAGIGSGAVVAGPAGGGLAAGAAGGGATGAAGAFGFMTATSWLAAALSLAAFLPLGWRAHGPSAAQINSGGAAVSSSPGGLPDDPFTVYPDSRILAIWRRLHTEHGSDAAAMPVIHQAILAEPNTFRRRALGIALMAEWAAVDPEGGFEKLWTGDQNTEQSAQLMREWLKLDPDAAAAGMLASLPGAQPLGIAIAGDFAELAPARFIMMVSALPKASEEVTALTYTEVFPNRTPLGEAFEQFARRDPEAAREALPSLKGQLLREAEVSVASLLAVKDPASALAWARARQSPINDGAGVSAPVAAVMAIWAGTDPVAALATVGTDPADQKRAGIVLETVANRDVEAAVRLRQAQEGKFNNDSWKVFYGPLTRRFSAEPAATLSFLKNQPPAIQEPLMRTLQVYGLGPAAQQTAWQWALAEKPEGMAASLCGRLLEAAVTADGREGWRKLKDLPPEWQASICRGDNMGYLMGQFTAGQLDDLLGSLSGEARSSLLLKAFVNGAHGSPPDLPLWRQRLEELPLESRPGAAGKFAHSLVSTDPMLAVSFADSIPEGPIRDQAYSELVGYWSYGNALPASQWVDQLPPGSGRDAAAAALVDRLGYRDPAAMSWASAISGGKVRIEVLTKLVDNALYQGPGAAAILLASPLLSGSDREALLKARPQLNSVK